MIKYSLLSIRTDDISRYLPGHIGYNSSSAGKMDAIKVFGAPVFLTALLDTQKSTPPRSPPAVDVNVRDNQGYSTLLTALGQGELNIKLGGYKVQVLSSAYNDPTYPEETIHEAVLGLLDAGGWLSAGSLRGVVPMHVAAARGDMKLIQLFADKKAALNPVDIDGFLPLHFLVSSCPNNAIAVFNELMSLASHRPMEAVTFEDYRTGQSLDYKNEIELDKHIDDRFLNAIVPQAIIKRRLSYSDLLLTKTNNGLNLLQLAMCGHVILNRDGKINTLLRPAKNDRVDLSLHITNSARKADVAEELFSNISLRGMSVLHSACILLEGVIPKRELTDREKRSKRVKTYPSKEINLLEWIKQTQSFDVNSWFEWSSETD